MWNPQPQPESGANWRSLVQAGVAAAFVMALLVGGVALAWNTGGGPASSATLAPEAPPTPTPRIMAFVPRETDVPPTHTAASPQLVVETAEPDSGGLVIVSTPTVMSLTTNNSSSDVATQPVLRAAKAADYAKLANGLWQADGNHLDNAGDVTEATRWLTLADVPSSDFAIEADLRVTGTMQQVCDQSFGLIGGSPSGKQVFGGGVIFPCQGADAARLTNATDWENGYNADEVLAGAGFAPGDGWRTYRLELQGGTLRLLIDGKEIATSQLDPGINPDAGDVEVGLWTQGVGVEVRDITVTSLT
ncbi:MAG: hypothetical protein QM692_02735 [Thermomicrobiales bacterium]